MFVETSAGPDTRIALSEVVIAFIPITEIIFDLGELPPPAPQPPAKNGKPAKHSSANDSGLYSWHIYGFERKLPRDWRFLNWHTVLMYIFGGLLALVLIAIVAISLIQL